MPLRKLISIPSLTDGPHREHASRQLLVLAAVIFICATGARLLRWNDLQPDIENGKMHFGMSDSYKADALNLLSGRIDLFVKGPDPPSDADILVHPPGYALIIAMIFGVFGDSVNAWRLANVLLDGLAVLGVLLLAWQLLPKAAAIVAAFLVSFSPQIVHTSLVLLPDSLAVTPIVWAMYLIVLALRRPHAGLIGLAGLLVGISSWLRPNALLLAPFIAAAIVILFPRVFSWRYAIILVGVTVVVIAPITIRNLIVFRQFIPLSIGVGNIICEGIADYDDEHRFGLLEKDHLVNQWEAQFYQRPDYTRSLFSPDGMFRDRERLKRGTAVIKSDPVWFAGVMMRRTKFILTYEQVPVVSPLPGVTHALSSTSKTQPVWTVVPEIRHQSSSEEKILFESERIPVSEKVDYVAELPVDLAQGRLVIKVTDATGKSLLASAAVPDALVGLRRNDLALNTVQVPFLSNGYQFVKIVIADTGEGPLNASVGEIKLYNLGESSFAWTRLPRIMLRTIQKRFTTRQMLPLVGVGLILLLMAGGLRQLLIFIVVPVYYVTAQATLHTEYRYVIANHYFTHILAAFAIYCAFKVLATTFESLKRS